MTTKERLFKWRYIPFTLHWVIAISIIAIVTYQNSDRISRLERLRSMVESHAEYVDKRFSMLEEHMTGLGSLAESAYLLADTSTVSYNDWMVGLTTDQIDSIMWKNIAIASGADKSHSPLADIEALLKR